MVITRNTAKTTRSPGMGVKSKGLSRATDEKPLRDPIYLEKTVRSNYQLLAYVGGAYVGKRSGCRNSKATKAGSELLTTLLS